MRSIDIRRAHKLTQKQAQKLVQSIAEDLAEKFGASYEWKDEAMRFQRPGVKGAVYLLPGEVHLRAELGLLFLPLKGTIENHINEFLDQHASSTDPEATRRAILKAAGELEDPAEEAAASPQKPAKKALKKATKKATSKNSSR